MKILEKKTLKVMTTLNLAVSINQDILWHLIGTWISNCFLLLIVASNSKKSCQGCELPSDDVPDSTSNSRGQNNNTPSATNNNQSNSNERTNGAISINRTTPNSTIDLGVIPNNPGSLMNSTSISNADSSVASTVSLEEEMEESPAKKKKEDGHGRKVKFD